MEHVLPLPMGTVTFLFTDIEGSTRLWEQQPQAMHAALARHDAVAAALIPEHAGTLVYLLSGAAGARHEERRAHGG